MSTGFIPAELILEAMHGSAPAFRILNAAHRWHAARAAFLALPPGDPRTRACLNELCEAEDALFQATRPIPAETPRALDKAHRK